MKIKVTQKMIDEILTNPDKVKESGIKAGDPWWLILLKVISYALGLIIAGAATTSCANMVGII